MFDSPWRHNSLADWAAFNTCGAGVAVVIEVNRSNSRQLVKTARNIKSMYRSLKQPMFIPLNFDCPVSRVCRHSLPPFLSAVSKSTYSLHTVVVLHYSGNLGLRRDQEKAMWPGDSMDEKVRAIFVYLTFRNGGRVFLLA